LHDPAVDFVIPVYNEGSNIRSVLNALERGMTTPARLLICYDSEDDDTLPAVREYQQAGALRVEIVRNSARGPHSAIMAGLRASKAPFVMVYPADDDFNADIIDRMIELAQGGCDIVCASRLMRGGTMQGAPPLKSVLVRLAAWTLYHLARLPTHDPTSGFRLFSRRVIEQIPIESDRGFCFSLELLVKVHRLGWRVGEVPAVWFERKHGSSRFRVFPWLGAYLRWYRYAFATTWLRRPPHTVPVR
jgi:glycosyltransferase involved in cell wall biosynthesis